MSFLNFNAATVAPQETFEPVPAGTYLASIEESEIKETKSRSGQILNLTWRVLDGQFKGRKVFDRVNIVNQNPKATEIGQRQLSAICHAANVLQLNDTQQLHGIPMTIKVIIRKDETGQYADQNEVKGYTAPAGQAPVQIQGQMGMQQQPGVKATPARQQGVQAPWAL